MSYAVKEIFLTLQGEGAHAGRAAVVTTKLRFDYLRAAQAYMLISMPTAISTISGFFQAMSSSQ